VTEDYEALNAAKAYDVDAFTTRRYAQFARHFAGASRILDAGCGSGDGGAVLRRTNPSAHIEGLELVTARSAVIPAGIYNEVTVGDLATIDVDLPFDALVMGELIEHVPFTALEQLISSAATLLTPGGRLLLTTPNPHYLLLRWRGRSILGGAHVSAHCPAVLSELLNHRGFRVVRVEGSGRVSRVVGVSFPLTVYGSYMLIAERLQKPR
jgi:2-polyprenyl-3-methyl-5-hydroxy-6-metoxy-1,4-benzoquinol methylase